jgi:hypothetical protein
MIWEARLEFMAEKIRNIPRGKLRRRWEDNIKMKLKRKGMVWTRYIWLSIGKSGE